MRIWLLVNHEGMWLDCDIVSVLPIQYAALAAETPEGWIEFRSEPQAARSAESAAGPPALSYYAAHIGNAVMG